VKRVVLVVAVVALAAAAPAFGLSSHGSRTGSAAGPAGSSQLADLGAQVRALQAQVKGLQAQVKTLQKQVKNDRLETAANYAGDACLTALTADALQSSWLVIDSIATTAQSKTYFNSQTPLDDRGACKAISVTRTLPTPGVVPTVSPFDSFLSWIVNG